MNNKRYVEKRLQTSNGNKNLLNVKIRRKTSKHFENPIHSKSTSDNTKKTL